MSRRRKVLDPVNLGYLRDNVDQVYESFIDQLDFNVLGEIDDGKDVQVRDLKDLFDTFDNLETCLRALRTELDLEIEE